MMQKVSKGIWVATILLHLVLAASELMSPEKSFRRDETSIFLMFHLFMAAKEILFSRVDIKAFRYAYGIILILENILLFAKVIYSYETLNISDMHRFRKLIFFVTHILQTVRFFKTCFFIKVTLYDGIVI